VRPRVVGLDIQNVVDVKNQLTFKVLLANWWSPSSEVGSHTSTETEVRERMKRYLVTGHGKEGKFALREKEIEEGLRKTGFDLAGEGQAIVGGELEEGGFFMVTECEGPVEEFLADLLTVADIEIKPIALCPKDCTACPEPMLVEPLRET